MSQFGKYLASDSNRAVTSSSFVEENITTPSKRRRKKRRRNEYDFGKKRKYPRQEKQQGKRGGGGVRRGLCLISSHKLQATTGDLYTVPVSSGTVLEEYAEICDLRTGEGQDSVSSNTELHTRKSAGSLYCHL